jgi:hypothetical protein
MQEQPPSTKKQLFRLTSRAINTLKREPPEHTWNGGEQYTRLDFSWWVLQIILYVGWIIFALMIDLALLPLRLLSQKEKPGTEHR